MPKNKSEILKAAKLEGLKIHKEKSYDHLFYSSQRYDLLIVAIASFGILQALGLVTFVVEKKPEVGLLFLLLSVGAFVITILSNLYSQKMSQKSNLHEFLCTEQKIKRVNKDDSFSEEVENYENAKADKFEWWNNFLNNISLYSLIIGILLAACFVYQLSHSI